MLTALWTVFLLLVGQQMMSATGVAYGHHPSSYGVYGTYEATSYLPAPPGQRPKCASEGDTFCSTIDYYPTEVIQSLMKKYSFDFKTLLQDETMESMMSSASTPSVSQHSTGHVYVPTVPLDSPVNATQTHGAEDWWVNRYGRPSQGYRSWPSRHTRQVADEERLCPITSSFITPRAAVNTRGNWMYVVNLEGSDQQTSQLVRTERCATTQCSGLCQTPTGFTSSCSQQFVQKRLVALNGNGESLYTDTFWFPHCCICQVRAING